MSIRPTAFTWLRNYQTAWLATDVIAGVTLAAYLLPSAIGDASLVLGVSLAEIADGDALRFSRSAIGTAFRCRLHCLHCVARKAWSAGTLLSETVMTGFRGGVAFLRYFVLFFRMDTDGRSVRRGPKLKNAKPKKGALFAIAAHNVFNR